MSPVILALDSNGTANAQDCDGGLTAGIVLMRQVYPREDANGRNVTTDRLYVKNGTADAVPFFRYTVNRLKYSYSGISCSRNSRTRMPSSGPKVASLKSSCRVQPL